MHRIIVLLLLSFALASAPRPQAAADGARRSPGRLYPEPPTFLLLPLGGDRAHFHYTPGSLDRAANLQQRMEIVGRSFERWSGQRTEVDIFVINRREWREARIDVDYGIPVRVGTHGIAVASRGDPETVELWSGLLGGRLPRVAGTPVLGTPREAASMVVSDVLVQLLAGEVLADVSGLHGDQGWVRAVIAHLAALSVVRRAGTDRPEDLQVFYGQLLTRHPAKAFSLRDYRAELPLEDWLWFQAQFHFSAVAIYDKEGKDAFKKIRKMKKKGQGLVRSEALRRKYKGLDEWLDSNFAVVSRR